MGQVFRPLDRCGRQPPHQSVPHTQTSQEATAQDARRTHRKKSPDFATIRQLTEAWAQGYAKGDPRRQACDRFAERFGHLKPRDLTPMLVNALIAEWKAKLAPSTAYHRRRIVAKLLQMMEQFGGAKLADQLPRLRRPQPRTVTASPAEIAALLREAPAWQRLFVTLAWQLGLRHAECYRVTPRSHNREKETVTIQRKGGQTQTLPTTPDVEALLAAAGDTSGREDLAYINILRGKDTTARASRCSWWRLAKKAGAEHIRPHDLRHTIINATYNITRDLRAAQQIAGHQSLQSTVSYLAPLTPEELRDYQRLLEFRSDVKQ